MSIFLALASTLATCIVLIFIHINRKISLLLALPSIAVGVGIGLVAELLQALGLYFNVIGGPDPVMTLFYGLFVVGLASQILSFLFLRFVIYTQKEFKEPLFVMLFAIWLAMGAVLLEIFSMPTSRSKVTRMSLSRASAAVLSASDGISLPSTLATRVSQRLIASESASLEKNPKCFDADAITG